MTKTTAPSKTPSPAGGETQHTSDDAFYENARRNFFGAALNMSWQLAVVVLIPIIGGHYLDVATETAPLFTLVGFFFAMAGTAAVVWHQLQTLSPAQPPSKETK